MTLAISNAALDIGIITRNPEAMLHYYCEVLGLELEAVTEMPGGGVMNRLRVGHSLLKIIELTPPAAATAVPGGIRAATGCRYWTIHVANLEQAVASIVAAGHPVPVAPRTLRPGVSIAIAEDPDRNWVELLQIDQIENSGAPAN